MKFFLTKLAGSLAMLGVVAQVSAQPLITYTQTGYLSGSLNGTSFENAAVTMTTIGDPANILYMGFIYILPGTVTIQIDGFSTATFIDTSSSHFGVISLNMDNEMPGVGIAGFVNYGEGLVAMLAIYETSPTYDLSTAGTLTGPAGSDGGTFGTDQGDLVLSPAMPGEGGTGSFTASGGVVPEPSELALSALGGFGLLWSLRRRK